MPFCTNTQCGTFALHLTLVSNITEKAYNFASAWAVCHTQRNLKVRPYQAYSRGTFLYNNPRSQYCRHTSKEWLRDSIFRPASGPMLTREQQRPPVGRGTHEIEACQPEQNHGVTCLSLPGNVPSCSSASFNYNVLSKAQSDIIVIVSRAR